MLRIFILLPCLLVDSGPQTRPAGSSSLFTFQEGPTDGVPVCQEEGVVACSLVDVHISSLFTRSELHIPGVGTLDPGYSEYDEDDIEYKVFTDNRGTTAYITYDPEDTSLIGLFNLPSGDMAHLSKCGDNCYVFYEVVTNPNQQWDDDDDDDDHVEDTDEEEEDDEVE